MPELEINYLLFTVFTVQDESGTGEGAKRANGNLPSQPSVIKVKFLFM